MEITLNTNEIVVKTKSDGGYVGCFNTVAEALDVVVHSPTLQKDSEDTVKFCQFLNGK